MIVDVRHQHLSRNHCRVEQAESDDGADVNRRCDVQSPEASSTEHEEARDWLEFATFMEKIGHRALNAIKSARTQFCPLTKQLN